MAADAARRETGAVVRFVLSGGFNTLLTGGLVALLAQWMSYGLAYTISFGLGIVLALFLASRFVFRQRSTFRRSASFVGMYLAVYLVGLGVLRVLEGTGAPRWTAGLVILVTAPLSYIGGRLIFWGTKGRPASEGER